MQKPMLIAIAATVGFAGAGHAATLPSTPAIKGLSAANAPLTVPDPGHIIVRLDGLLDVNVGVSGSSIDKGQGGTVNAGAKNQAYGMQGFFRLYFGVDGKLANGIIYGANAEMRTNFAGAQAGTYTGTNAIGNGSANTTASLWYTRRAYVYVGAPGFGLLRAGQGDGPLSLFTGTTSSELWSTNGWDGGDPALYMGGAALSWAIPDTGNEYGSNKLVYLSPKLAGFTLGASFAPSSAALSANSGTNAASGGFDRQSASTLASDLTRPRNVYELAVRYDDKLGPVGVFATLGHMGGNTIAWAGVGAAPSRSYGLDVQDAGLALSYAGVTLNAHATFGKMNGVTTPEPKTPHSKDGMAWVVGPQYQWGNVMMGASYYVFESTGSGSVSPAVGGRMERGFDVGGVWTVTPGLDVYAEYLYGTRYQRGVNFIDPAGAAATGNRTQGQSLVTSMIVRW